MDMVLLLRLIVLTISKWGIFRKAGRRGWAALIPFYSDYVMSDIMYGNKKYFTAAVLLHVTRIVSLFQWRDVLEPFCLRATLILSVIAVCGLVKAFEKDYRFELGMVLVPVIFWPMLAFDRSQYNGLKKPALTDN